MQRTKTTVLGSIAAAGAFLVVANSAAAMPPLVLTGRVQAIDVASSTIRVLNHVVKTSSARAVVVGQLVNVYGVNDRRGCVDHALVETVPAFSEDRRQLFVAGEITQIDTVANVVTVGGTQVKLSELAESVGANAIHIGRIVQISGESLPSGGVALHSAIMGGSGEQATIMGGSDDRIAIMGGSGEQASIMGGSGDRAAIMGGSGEDQQ